MNVAGIIGRNIKELIDNANKSIRSMAELIDVTHPTMSKYLNGEQVIDSEKLYIIADYFGKNFDYFYQVEHKQISLMFRADKPEKNLEHSDYNFMIKKIEEYIDFIEVNDIVYIPQSYTINVKDSQLSDENEVAIERIAYEQRKTLGIENIIPDNYYSTLSEQGINVLCFDLNNNILFGASSFTYDYGNFVFINSNYKISEERQIFSLFHEYGHLLFHRNEYLNPEYNPFYKQTKGNINEKIADTFAGYFLLPKNLVKKYINDRNGEVSILEMKNHFKVSIQALYYVLHKYKIISATKYKEFWKNVSINNWKKVEPKALNHLSHEEKNIKLFSELKKLYCKEEISINKISEVLETDTITTRNLVKNWMCVDNEYEKILSN